MMLNLAGVFAGEETLPFETRLDLSLNFRAPALFKRLL